MPTNYVLLPIQYHNVWALYKDLQSVFWTVEDVLGVTEVDANGLQSNEALQLLNFVAASNARATSALASDLCPAAEFGCFLGLQVFLESVHLEGAARVVAEGASTSPPAAINAWATAEQCGGGGNSLSILLYCVAFWAAWTNALTAWHVRLEAPVHAGMDALATNMHRDGLLFLKFAIEMLCSARECDEVGNDENKALLQVYYTRLAADMEATLGVALDDVKDYEELANEIEKVLRAPRNITVRKKRDSAGELDLDADF